ncbi:MAG: hypothetical protein IJ390_00550 [Lachnospiraceae bacterium]|nr:hypothetical protein [Lachnospiraceae bacterium]
MRKGNKRLWAAFLAATVVSASLAGCGQSAEKTDSAAAETTAAVEKTDSAAADAAGEDAPKELKTIRILGPDNSAVDNNGNTIYFSDWVNGESKKWEQLVSDLEGYGVKLELDLIPADQIENVVQTQIAAGLDYDMVNISTVDTKTRMSLVEQGKLVSVNEIWENYSDGTAKEYYTTGAGSSVAKLNKLEDGNQYWLTGVTYGDYKGRGVGSLVGAMIRYDWLQKLGLEMPTTTEELYQTLLAFQEQDANGNGQADEVITLNYNSFYNGIAQMYGLGTSSYFLDSETGKITSPWYQDGIKDYITFMNRLFKAGLLDTSGQAKEKQAENKISMVSTYWIGYSSEAAVTVPEGEQRAQFVGLVCDPENGCTPLVNSQSAVQKNTYDFAFTSNVDKEAAGRLLDYLTSEEYATLTEFGIEGYSYEVVDGVKQRFTDSDISECQIRVALWVNDCIFPRAETVDRAQELVTATEMGKSMGWPEEGFAAKADPVREVYENPDKYKLAVKSTELEVAVATVEETERIADLKTDFDTYSEELLTKLIMGDASLDNWDTYIAEMKELGLDELIEITQARYDRTLG